MSTLSFKNVNKIYPNGAQAVFDFNLDVNDKEFIVFVGPSGCGKTTTLRMLAGLEEITSGEIYIDDKLINNVEPKNRNIAMVFQSYALYPYMTVYKNMSFALELNKANFPILDESGNQKMTYDEEAVSELETKRKELIKKLPKAERNDNPEVIAIDKQIEEIKANLNKPAFEYRHLTKKEIDDKILAVSKILGLEPYLYRKPSELSGGQKQRVALGRAIVREPKVFLMDEPLSNLDAKLRVQMRSEIVKIHKRVNATTIYVTHDQTEAMSMATRIVCMKDGYIQQIGTPKELFNEPVNMFVASFLGAPAMNFINGVFDGKKFIAKNEEETVAVELNDKIIKSLKDYEGKELVLGIRPDDIFLSDKEKRNSGSNDIELKCDISELLGREYIVYTYIAGQKIIVKIASQKEVISGDVDKYYFDLDKIHFFDKDSTLKVY